ncbi:MAG: hypothetical protein KBC91_08245, partial [Candidatus Omnitrophica bacterium]|nr:hypothetical protein [Candidatus Omnitrophota bacterium]
MMRMLRATAWVTLTFFTNSSLGWADPQIAAVLHPKISETSAAKAVFTENTLRIPSELGVVQKSVQYDSGPTVILLQDMHANEQAQRNAAELLRYLSHRNGLRLIHMEGAEGDLFTNLFHAFPSRLVRKKIADYFLKEARLSGAEYAAVVDLPGWTLHGVESAELYQENLEAYLRTKDSQKELAPVMRQFDKVLKDLSTHVFPKELALFVSHRRA